MTAELLQPFYSVMHKYRKYFSDLGVKANLEKWAANKAGLLELLRRHPDWDEDAKAIIFPVIEERLIDRAIVNECREGLVNMSEGVLKRDKYDRFRRAFIAAVREYCSRISEDSTADITSMGGIKCVAGQKTSRVVNRLCAHFGIDKQDGYNSLFAKLSDALNPLLVDKNAVLSVHPCDYLEMSNKDNSWSSCHGLESGSYQAGCLSYMNDATTMIFYTVDKDVEAEFWRAPKRTRQVFCYSNGLPLQSRLYPHDGNETLLQQYRLAVQGILAVCMDAPDHWNLKRKDFQNYLLTSKESSHYMDYTSYGTLSLIKGREFYGSIPIGDHALCVTCGGSLRGGSMSCHCDSRIVCAGCGETVPASNAVYEDAHWYCRSCLHICPVCSGSSTTPMVIVFDGRGGTIEMCSACAAHRMASCEGCNIRSVCGVIASSRFCPRMAEQAAA